MLPSSASQLIRFDVFELDVRAGELRKRGTKIRLQEQPFLVLEALLENPGQIVTREELQKKIWPQDTFVDFDHGLHSAVNRLREALSDSADNPRFVETLSRRGYRFIGQIQSAPAVSAAEISPVPVVTKRDQEKDSPVAGKWRAGKLGGFLVIWTISGLLVTFKVLVLRDRAFGHPMPSV